MSKDVVRKFPVGAERLNETGTHFRVWAPKCRRVEVVTESNRSRVDLELSPEPDGYFSLQVPEAGPGTRYWLRLDGGADLYPDPASRFQPEGPHGPSEVVDPAGFRWTDKNWRGIRPNERVIYEMHLGTFTKEGTWEAAVRELPELAAAGITILEIMPVADFPGRFGWGYDGVCLFAPCRLYGSPDDFRRFVDRAHAVGLGVILDVVYNHLGPNGNHLAKFADGYFTEKYANDWGAAINFDGDDAGPARVFFVTNARYWIDEFHLDGLRLDATQQIFDASPVHIIAEIVQAVRAAGAGRGTFVVGENEPQDCRLVRPVQDGGYGLDALWNDDLHHSAMVALTGRREAYYTDYHGDAQEFISALKWGFLYQGQRYRWQKKRRGTPALDLAAGSFVTFIQNHDQVANSGSGQRCHQLTSPARYRAMTALWLLGPGTPMFFQGQEFAASSPFFYFADHPSELAEQVRKGRAEFLSQFPSVASPGGMAALPAPHDPTGFERCKLNFAERETNRASYDLHRDLIRLRRDDPTLRAAIGGRAIDGAVLASDAFVIRFFGESCDDRLLLVNFGHDRSLDEAPEPLLAPPRNRMWKTLWSSEDPRYGGCGTAPLEVDDGWRLPGEAAVLLMPAEAS